MGNEETKIPGEPSKRYRWSYNGVSSDSYDTVKEMLEKWDGHNKLIRPVVDRKNQGSYSFFDGRKEITLQELRNAAEAERRAGRRV